jgi:hypothetical protein
MARRGMRVWLGGALTLAWLATGEVGAFGEPGHRVVGRIAEMHLAGSRALEQVARILRPRETLADAGVWPDTIRNTAYEDGDTAQFRLRHPAHEVYHFTNIPFQSDRYAPDLPGAHAQDIVQIARESIRVLRGRSTSFTEREALRVLAHLVGDIHQPLHVGNGFVSAAAPFRFVLPEGPTGWRSSAGGNALRYGPKDTFNLHAYWDTHAVNLAMQKQDVPTYAARLVKELGTPPNWRNTGDVEAWPDQWATEALLLAKAAYADIRIVQYLDGDQSRGIHRWRIEQPPGYDKLARSRVPGQLARGGYRLAATLRAIWPD